MSLINQMLRDLEQRHKQEKVGGDPLTKPEPPPVAGAAPAKRSLLLATGGLLVVALIWLGLEFVPVELFTPQPVLNIVPPDKYSQRVAIVRGQEIFAALEEKNAANASLAGDPIQPEKPDVTQRAGSRDAVVANRQDVPIPSAAIDPAGAAPARAAPAKVQEKSRLASGTNVANLLSLGILESAGSARLMLEFEQIPDYQVVKKLAGGKVIRFRFKGTQLRSNLEIPRLKGPLLKRISLLPKGSDLQIQIDLARSARLRTLSLPADSFHGDRLLVELHEEQPTAAPSQAGRAARVAVSQPPVPPKKNSAEAAKTEKTRSHQQQAEQVYQAGLEQLKMGDREAAEEKFTQALSLQPRLLEARLQLIELLLQMQRNTEAKKQLELGLNLHPGSPKLRKAFARQLLLDEELIGAIGVLSSEPLPAVSSDLEYHALLAALQQEAGQHAAAARRYGQLLKVRPREALWWMGMAIALEQSGEAEQAGRAYRHALSLPGLRPDLSRYVRERLEAL